MVVVDRRRAVGRCGRTACDVLVAAGGPGIASGTSAPDCGAVRPSISAPSASISQSSKPPVEIPRVRRTSQPQSAPTTPSATVVEVQVEANHRTRRVVYVRVPELGKLARQTVKPQRRCSRSADSSAAGPAHYRQRGDYRAVMSTIAADLDQEVGRQTHQSLPAPEPRSHARSQVRRVRDADVRSVAGGHDAALQRANGAHVDELTMEFAVPPVWSASRPTSRLSFSKLLAAGDAAASSSAGRRSLSRVSKSRSSQSPFDATRSVGVVVQMVLR